MKYAPRKVFILENDHYTEISYEELCQREQTDPSYKDKCFIPLHGMIMEVKREHYDDFYRSVERQRYIRIREQKYGLLSLDAFDTETDKGTDFLCVSTEDVAELVAQKMLLDKLHAAVHTLDAMEQQLIREHFEDGIPQTELAAAYGISQQAISKRILRICAKLKKIIGN